MVASEPDATGILRAHMSGDAQAAERLLPLVYDELRALAAQRMRREDARHTLQATALVHEAYVRLIDLDRIEWQGEAHFRALAARTMRRVLIDHARAKRAEKRGGGGRAETLIESGLLAPQTDLDVLDLDDALERLAAGSPRQARVVELRLMGGLSVEEVAASLEVSVDTVKRDWRFARAWLNRELTKGDEDERAGSA